MKNGGIEMQRGQLWVASFKLFRGREIGKARPCMIVQAEWLTAQSSGTIIVLPLTSQLWQDAESLRHEVSARGRLRQSSWIMIDKIQALDASRFRDGPLGSLSATEIDAVEVKLKAVLGLL